MRMAQAARADGFASPILHSASGPVRLRHAGEARAIID
jgi:hypothetical protein